ncbi:dihydrofolate reductase family protein [Cellulomonas sp. PhB150]|uniref:dihydrofolate reductase family protein n=1 Tax=Cellulomonas sp. PhB150 TaxID=2485188 RepID=UPI000F48A314|nr:dihydrofolate reductase family protein [Cellulomonas sp. PhB150]ROS30837.1 riboflavin biosynthesis pyrimidine reductase [Cellulomonas sp. PhB150]
MTDSPALDVLLPLDRAGQRLEPRDDEADLLALFGPSPARLVRANMVATLDGAGTGADGVTASINGPADLRVFRALRAQAEVVLVGAGTARDEGYRALDVPVGLARARDRLGLPPRIELAIVTARGDLPDVLLDAERPPFLVTTADAPLDALRARVGADHVLAHGTDGRVDLAAALESLAALGLGRVLAEGGPGLLAQLVAQGLVDELCLTWSPLLVGGPAPRILGDGPWLDPARPLVPVHLLHADGVLLGRWRAR